MELTALSPGQLLNHIPYSAGPLEPREGWLQVRVPARTHLSVLDMNHFAPGRPGGGGIGYAVGLYAEVELELIEEPEYLVFAKRAGVVSHVAGILAKSLDYQGGVRIKAKDHNINHMGLGSTSALLTAVAWGINTLLGSPLGSRDLRRLIGYNFAEDAPNGMVVPGFETGVGPAAGIHGGFVVLADRLELIHHAPLPDATVYLAFLKGDMAEKTEGGEAISSSQNAGQLEAELLLNQARDIDTRDAREKAHEVLFGLLPSLKADSLKGIGDSVWRLQQLGSKLAEIGYHSNPDRICQTMEDCRGLGALVTGMSSVGPAITILCEREESVEGMLEDYLKAEDIKYMKTGVDNQGVVTKWL